MLNQLEVPGIYLFLPRPYIEVNILFLNTIKFQSFCTAAQ